MRLPSGESLHPPRDLTDAAIRPCSPERPCSVICPWIKDRDLLEHASRVLLRPLEFIRSLALDVVYDIGIDIALWETTPAIFRTVER